MNTPFIEVKDLVVHYGDKLILDKISFQVQTGEVLVVIGGSGCGKTTLFRTMTGLKEPTSGSVLLSGEDITTLDEEQLSTVQRQFGIAFQSSGLFNSLTVGENVALPIREYGNVDESLIDAIVRLKLSLVGLGDCTHMMPAELSGGMRKRAGLARAIALDPPLVYFDEPSAGLDPIMAAGLDDLILDLKRLLGITLVIVTHELDSIRKVSDHVIMLDIGQIIFEGTLEEDEASTEQRTRQFFERRADASIGQRGA